MSPASGQTAFQAAIRLHQEGRLDEAEQIYRRILADNPNHPGALHLLGVVHHQRNDHATALDLIARAIALDATKAIYFNNYGAALQSLGRYAEAQAHFRRALEIEPRYSDALANLGMAQASLGDHEAALASFRKTLEIEPKHSDAWTRLASLLQQLGRYKEAVRLYEKAIADCPSADRLAAFGDLLMSIGRTAEALEKYRHALAIQPDHAAALFSLGGACQEMHEVEEARKHFARAAQLRPDQPFWRHRALALCPAVFHSTAEVDAYREELSAVLDRWRETSPPSVNWNDLVTAGVCPTMTFAYHGRNNRWLKERFAALYEPYFRDVPKPAGSGLGLRKRIGIVVTQRHEGIFLRCMMGIVEHLDAERFELVVLAPEATLPALRRAFSRQDLVFVPLPNLLTAAAERIRQAACDVLYYWEVGSDALNYFLPLARLAPVQCTSHGSQITSGIPTVDWFYSSSLTEPPDGQEHYTEKLWRSQTLLMCQSRLPPVARGSRADFGLHDERHLYMCLQNPLKLHPDIDSLLGGILETDPQGLVVLLAGRHENVPRLLRQRFAKQIPAVADRILFLPWQNFTDYCRLLQHADVLLDPPHHTAGSSAYDIFSFNQPLVTMVGKLSIGRATFGFYKKMGIRELITSSPTEYVSKAVEVATDLDYRKFVQERIAATSDVVFEDIEAVREHERFFDEVLALSAGTR